MMKIIVMIGIVTLAACDPGPLPDPAGLSTLERRADWFPNDSNDPYPLDLAIRSDRVDEVRRLLASGIDPNKRWSQTGDRFPLREALDAEGRSGSNQTEIVRLLLAHGADANARWCPMGTRNAWSEWGGDRQCQSSRGTTPLIQATSGDRREIVELLLLSGADPAAEDWRSGSALDYATDDIIFEMIGRQQFPDLDTRDKHMLAWLDRHFMMPGSPLERTTPLSRALWSMEETGASRGRLRIVLGLEPDANERFGNGETPLSIAMRVSLPVVELLLHHGADVNLRWCPNGSRDFRDPQEDSDCSIGSGMTPLMWAVRAGNVELIRMLLASSADRSLKDWAGRSALDYARDEVVRKLLTANSTAH